MTRWLGVPVIWAATSSPTLTPPIPCTRPVSLVAPVTAAVTDGPAPPMVTDVPLTRQHPAGEQHPQLPIPVTGQPRESLRSGAASQRRSRRARRHPSGRARRRSAPGQEEPHRHPGDRGRHRDRDGYPGRESWDAPVAPASCPVPEPGPRPRRAARCRKRSAVQRLAVRPLAVRPLALRPLALRPLAVQLLLVGPLAVQPLVWRLVI